MAERPALPEGWRLTSEGESIHRLTDPSGETRAVVIRNYDDWTARLTRQGEHRWSWSAPLMRDVVPQVLRHLGAVDECAELRARVAELEALDGCAADAPCKQAEAESGGASLTHLVGEFDARVWAAAFVATVRDHPTVPTDEGAMLAWFAGAIMAGYDRAEVPTNPTVRSEPAGEVASGGAS